MSLFSNVLLVCLLCAPLYRADDLQVGSSDNALLAYQERIRLRAIPLTARTENIHFGSRTIKAIFAIDKDKSNAKPTIIAGGVGTNYVHLRLTSEIGARLNYQVQIYV